jgi:hypothetical protein
MPNEDPWFDETEEKKQLRRDAATKFLVAAKDDVELRRAVISNPSYAREAFQKLGGIALPNDVQVICIDPERHERAKVVVFVLLDPNKETPAEPYREHWIAAWQPYR